jgi:uncharacterized protein (TIGR02452 family)
MIKRDGVPLMNERTNNVKLAKQTLDVIKNKGYTSPSGKLVDLSNKLEFSINNSVLYTELLPTKYYEPYDVIVEVVNETTAQAAQKLSHDGRVVALNFASARNPGGGFLSGAIAQEEDLTRASGLYACLKSKPMFYNKNILCESCLYTDDIIYSPDVPFFRDEHGTFLEEPFVASVISAPAPNIRGPNLDKTKVEETFYRRILQIINIAALHDHDIIILGAWGCGAFGNNPEMVASIFKEVLHVFPAFKRVHYAVFDNREGTPIFNTFQKVLK